MKKAFLFSMLAACASISYAQTAGVGIDVTSPKTKLHVAGAVTYDEAATAIVASGTTASIPYLTNSQFAISGTPTAAFTITGPTASASGVNLVSGARMTLINNTSFIGSLNGYPVSPGQASDYVYSTSTGSGKWSATNGGGSIQSVLGVMGAGVDVPSTATGGYLQTGTTITLGPGKWAVNITMLLTDNANILAPTNSSFWMRSSFANSNGANPATSSDIIGSPLVSGNLIGDAYFGLATGTVVINNTSGANKTYYYIVGSVTVYNTTQTLTRIGGSAWLEDNIIAYRL